MSDSEFPGENGNDDKNAKNANAKKAENAKDGANANEFLAARFESHRGHLRAVAYRMLGSLSEASTTPSRRPGSSSAASTPTGSTTSAAG